MHAAAGINTSIAAAVVQWYSCTAVQLYYRLAYGTSMVSVQHVLIVSYIIHVVPYGRTVRYDSVHVLARDPIIWIGQISTL
eukprot:COSAG01_NODE_140_length_24259_cov_41.225096_16_plen_81_part_00